MVYRRPTPRPRRRALPLAALAASLVLLAPRAGAALERGDVLVSDRNNGRILRVDPDTGSVETLAEGDELVEPVGMTLVPDGADGTLYVVDRSAEVLVRVDPETGDQSVMGNFFPGGIDGDFEFFPADVGEVPFGLEAGPEGELYVSAPGSEEIREVTVTDDLLAPVSVEPLVEDPELSDARHVALSGRMDDLGLAVAVREAGALTLDLSTGELSAPLDEEPSPAEWWGVAAQELTTGLLGGPTEPFFSPVWTQLERDGNLCVEEGAAVLVSLAFETGSLTGERLRCPFALDLLGAVRAFVADAESTVGGDARLLSLRDDPEGEGGLLELVATLPPPPVALPAPTLPGDVVAVPEPAAGAGLAALAALGGLARRRRRLPRTRSP